MPVAGTGDLKRLYGGLPAPVPSEAGGETFAGPCTTADAQIRIRDAAAATAKSTFANFAAVPFHSRYPTRPAAAETKYAINAICIRLIFRRI